MAERYRAQSSKNYYGNRFFDQENNLRCMNIKPDEDSKEDISECNKALFRKPQFVSERKEIANIFTELIFIISTHSKENILKQSSELELTASGYLPPKQKIVKTASKEVSPHKPAHNSARK
jgi:hypothetical protein